MHRSADSGGGRVQMGPSLSGLSIRLGFRLRRPKLLRGLWWCWLVSVSGQNIVSSACLRPSVPKRMNQSLLGLALSFHCSSQRRFPLPVQLKYVVLPGSVLAVLWSWCALSTFSNIQKLSLQGESSGGPRSSGFEGPVLLARCGDTSVHLMSLLD